MFGHHSVKSASGQSGQVRANASVNNSKPTVSFGSTAVALSDTPYIVNSNQFMVLINKRLNQWYEAAMRDKRKCEWINSSESHDALFDRLITELENDYAAYRRTKTGKVKLEFANGDVYEGDFADGMKHGKGVLTKANGEIQEGEWSEDNYLGTAFVPPPNQAFSTGST